MKASRPAFLMLPLSSVSLAAADAQRRTFHDGVKADAVVQALARAAASDRTVAVEYESES